MRSDVTLYVVAALFFAIAIAASIIFTKPTDKIFWIVLSISLGGAVMGAGYSQKPKTIKPIKTVPTTPTATPSTESATQLTPVEETLIEDVPVEDVPVEDVPVEDVPVETHQAIDAHEETPDVVEAQVSSVPQEQIPPVATQNNETSAPIEQEETSLTSVKGVGEKRAAQLNALGINTVEDLAQVSVEDLAKNLKISPKIAAKLIEAAKQQ